MEITKCVEFQIPRYNGFKVGIFPISPILPSVSSSVIQIGQYGIFTKGVYNIKFSENFKILRQKSHLMTLVFTCRCLLNFNSVSF